MAIKYYISSKEPYENVYAIPDEKGKVVAMLHPGTRVYIIKKLDDGWAQIGFNQYIKE